MKLELIRLPYLRRGYEVSFYDTETKTWYYPGGGTGVSYSSTSTVGNLVHQFGEDAAATIEAATMIGIGDILDVPGQTGQRYIDQVKRVS